jgi:hypothetical protein
VESTKGVSAFSHWGNQGSESGSMGFVVMSGARVRLLVGRGWHH